MIRIPNGYTIMEMDGNFEVIDPHGEIVGSVSIANHRVGRSHAYVDAVRIAQNHSYQHQETAA